MAWLLLVLLAGTCYAKELTSEHQILAGQEVSIESVNYPEDADANLRQTWVLKAPEGSKISLNCEDLRLFDMNPCGDYAVEFKDDSGTSEVCGSLFGYERVSSGSWLSVTLRTGEWPRGFLKCKATVEGSVGGVSTPSSGSIWDFMNEESEEVDSSEHGGPSGRVPTSCACGWAHKSQKRIFGGRETRVNEFPFIVALTMGPNPSAQFCGGSILTPRHVITAAHCTYGQTEKLYVSVAEHHLSTIDETEHTRQIGVARIIDHEGFSRYDLQNDISMLLLDEPITFNQYAGPVCLLNRFRDLKGEMVKIIGWGRSPENPWGSPFLQKVDLKMIPKDTCHAIAPSMIPKGSPTQICTYGTGKSACSGDSGGPVVWVDPDTNRYTLVGLVSFGVADCGTKPRYSTDVNAFLGWIQKTIQESDPSYSTCSKIE